MQSKAATVAQYLNELPADRRGSVEAVRKVVLANMDPALDVVADAFRRVTVKDHIAIY